MEEKNCAHIKSKNIIDNNCSHMWLLRSWYPDPENNDDICQIFVCYKCQSVFTIKIKDFWKLVKEEV